MAEHRVPLSRLVGDEPLLGSRLADEFPAEPAETGPSQAQPIKMVPLPAEFGTEILRCQVGSGLHGVTIDGTDDRDEMGICVEVPEALLGLGVINPKTDRPREFEQWTYRTQAQGVRSGPGDLDLTVYGLRKWARLAAAGNPTVLLPLFAPADQYVILEEPGLMLTARSELFITRLAAARFLGYLDGQRQQMMGLRPGKRHTNRPELIAEHGFDTKSAYHMVRLGVQGVELLTTGRISLPMTDQWRQWLTALRRGEHTRAEADDMARSLIDKLVTLRNNSPVPEVPDYAAINRLLLDITTDMWRQR